METKQRKGSSQKTKKWSARVNATSNSLDLKENLFKSRNAEDIAKSLKRSAERSKRKKGTAFQSAMSMLNFYINRAGKKLTPTRKKVLEATKQKLRDLFHRKKT